MHRIDRIREEIAQEAARLMFEEGVKEYRDAKRLAELIDKDRSED